MNPVPEQPVTPSQRSVAEAFDFGAAIREIRPLGRGLINDTFLVVTDSPTGRHAVLQRINRRAFPQPELIAENLRTLAEHARLNSHSNRLRIPEIFKARDGKDFALDHDGGFWRALGYIDGCVTHQTIASQHQAEQAGAGLGRFHALVSNLVPTRMHATRPRFHKTPAYFERFTEVTAHVGDKLRGPELKGCAAFIEARRHIVSVLEDARERAALTMRVIHGDPKLDNFLFDAQSGQVVSLIDLDTVQPGLIHYDVGDCLRSCANPVGESPAKLDDVRFDLDICHAILTNYLAETRHILSPSDYAYFFDAIRLIPFELGLRFLTDHLENDTYFKIEWPGQNLHRAMAQFRLTADIEAQEDRIKKLIAQVGGPT